MNPIKVIVTGLHEAYEEYISKICKESSELKLETSPLEINDIVDFVTELKKRRIGWLIITACVCDERGLVDQRPKIREIADLRDKTSAGFRILAIADFPPKQNRLFHEDCKKAGADKFLYTRHLNEALLVQFLTDTEPQVKVELNSLEVFPFLCGFAVGDDTQRIPVPKIDPRHMQVLMFLIVERIARQTNLLESYDEDGDKITRVHRDPLWRALGSAFRRNVGKKELTQVIDQLTPLSRQVKTNKYPHNIEETVCAIRGCVKQASYLFETNEFITRTGNTYQLVNTIPAKRIRISLSESVKDLLSSSWNFSDKAKA